MSKRTLTLALLGVCTVMMFQNCAPGLEQADFASEVLTAQSIDVEHEDRDHDPTPFREDKIEVNAKDLIYDRVLLVNHLTSIFGTRVTALDKDNVATDMRNFASPCSPYEQYNYKNAKNAIANSGFRTCTVTNSAASMKASLYAETSTSRQGVMEHLCRALSSDTTSRTFALRKIASDGKPAGNKANVLKAFRLFYRSAPLPPDSVLQSMQVMLGREDVDAAAWTPVLFTLCVSPGWQVL